MFNDSDLLLLLGRLDGKMDALTVMHTATAQRLDHLEGNVNKVQQEVIAIQASSNSGQVWITHIGTVAALVVSAVAIYFGVF